MRSTILLAFQIIETVGTLEYASLTDGILMATSLSIGILLTLERMLGFPVNAAMASIDTLNE